VTELAKNETSPTLWVCRILFEIKFGHVVRS